MARKILIWSVKDVKESIEKMTSAEVKMDCIMFIEGKRGLGKSTLGYKIFSGLKVEQPFKPKRDLVYSREDTLRHLANKINGCIFSDEMINVAYKRDFYQEEQKDLLKAFDMYRDSRNVFIGCIPVFIDLDMKIQKVCKLRLTVIRRGIALVQMQNASIYSQDPWDVKNNQKIESKWALRGTKNPRYGQLTTVVGILRFGDLTPKQRKEYDEIKAEKRGKVFQKYQDMQMMQDPEQIFINNLTEELKAGKLTPKSFDQMCRINSKKPDMVRRKINAKLKEDGDEGTWKTYCLTSKARKRKEQMGFKVPKPIEVRDEPDKAKEDMTQTSQNDSEKETNVSNDTNVSDVLGFKS